MFKKLMSLFHRVDQVQQQTDSLNELIYGDSFSESDFLKRTYQMTPRQCERLALTLLKYQDEALSAFAFYRLQRLLNTNRGALAYFVDFQQLTAMLVLYFRSEVKSDKLNASIF